MDSGADVRPGVDGVGTLTVGNLTLDGAFHVTVDGTFAGQHDRLNVLGTVDISGATLDYSGAVTAAITYRTVTLIDNDGTSDSVTGEFAGLAEGATVTFNDAVFTLSYRGGDGNDVVLIPVSPAPLPPPAPGTPNTNTIAYTWTGAAGDGRWSTAGNWSGGVAPVAGNDLLFTGSGYTAENDFADGTWFNTIVINGSNITLDGNAIRLYGGLTSNHLSGTNTIVLNVALINAQTIMNANAGAGLQITGDIDTGELVGTTSIFGTSALTFDGSGSTEVSGSIYGMGSLSKLGEGMLTLSRANSYTGITDIRQGILVVADSNALGGSFAETQIQAGASLWLKNNVTITESLAIREGGIGFGAATDPSGLGALRSIEGNNVWAGNIDLAGGNNLVGVDLGATLNLSGVISNAISAANRLIKVGEGTLQISGTQENVFRGETRVLQGTLLLNKTPGLNAIGGSLVIGDDLEVTGTKTVRLLAGNQLPHKDFFGVALLTVTINSTGVLDLNGYSDAVGNITLANGVNDSADILLGGGTLTMEGPTLTVNGFQGSSPATPPATISGGTFDLGGFFGGGGGGVTKTFAINNTAYGSVDQDFIISANITGGPEISLTKTGAGVLTLSGNNTYQGPTLLTAGIVRIGSDSAFGTGDLSLLGSVLRATGVPRTVSNANVFINATLTIRGANDLTFTGLATLTASRTIQVLDPGNVTTFAGGITESIFGNLGLSKNGPGTLVLSGANTFTGVTSINTDGGTLRLEGNGTLLNTAGITVADGGMLEIKNTAAANLADRVGDRTHVTLNGGELVFTTEGVAASETFAGLTAGGNLSSTITSNISGGATSSVVFAGLNRGGGATLNFVGGGEAITADGNNRVSFANAPAGLVNGILPFSRVRGPGGEADFVTFYSVTEGIGIAALPATGYVTDLAQAGEGSNVRIGAGQEVTLTTSKRINSLFLEDGAIINGVPGVVLTVTNGSNLSGLILGDGVQINVETLQFGNEAFIATVMGSQATITSNIIGGNTSITKAGTGTLVLTGDNQFNGAMNVNAGTLNIQRSTSLGSSAGATNVRQEASLELEETTFGAINLSVEAINLAGTGIDDGGALRNIAGSNSVAGNVVLTGVVVDGASFFPSTNVVAPGAAFINTVDGSLNLSGIVSGNVELIKFGAGTLELSGANSNTHNATRVKEGTLFLNKEPGLNAISNSNSNTTLYVGDDDEVGAPAILRLGGSDQIPDNVNVTVGSTGILDFNGYSDAINQLVLVIGPNGASQVTLGATGVLILANQTTSGTIPQSVIVHSIGNNGGAGHPSGAQITGGTIALNLTSIPTAVNRIFLVNDGAAGVDLTITSAITDGTGLVSMGINKTGFGTMELGGTDANTFSGLMDVQQGHLGLNKAPGVNAVGGALTVGGTNVDGGFSGSRIVTYLASHQLPDYLAPVIVNITGKLDLNGLDDVIGNMDGQTALTVNGGIVTTGAGILGIRGNIVATGAQGAGLWTPIVARISGNLDLGRRQRGHRHRRPRPTGRGPDHRSQHRRHRRPQQDRHGGSAALAGATPTREHLPDGGHVGGRQRYRPSASAGSISRPTSTSLLAHGGSRTLANEFYFGGVTINLLGGNSVGGGGNDLTFSGPVNLTTGTTTLNTAIAGVVEFSGGIGETIGSSALSKSGFGTMILSGRNTYSGATTVNTNGGTIILRGEGQLLNTSTVTINVGGELILDNGHSGTNGNRINDAASIVMNGGTLTLKAAATGAHHRGLRRGDAERQHLLRHPFPGGGGRRGGIPHRWHRPRRVCVGCRRVCPLRGTWHGHRGHHRQPLRLHRGALALERHHQLCRHRERRQRA